MSDTMTDAEKFRVANFDLALIGMWDREDKAYSYFFFGNGEFELMAGSLPISLKYEPFLKGDLLSLKIINDKHSSGKQQILEYEVQLIDTKQGVLKLKNY